MNIAEYRKSHKPLLTLAVLAKRIGCSEAALSRYENGRVPSPDVMQKIIDATEGAVTPDDFFDLPSATPAKPPTDIPKAGATR